MTVGPVGPPRLARLLLGWATSGRYRQAVLGDVEEAFRVKAASMGVNEARRWYWGQVIRSLAPSLGVRLRPRGRGNWTRVDPQHGQQRRYTTLAEELKMGGWIRHAKLAVRSLARNPGFAVLAIVTLALGIGANTAIFSVIDGALLRPLPYSDPDGLVYLSDGHEEFGGAGINQSIPNLLDLRSASSLLSDAAIFTYRNGNLATAERPERVRILRTSHEMLSVLGVAPRLGRDLLLENDLSGSPAVAILTDQTWRARFGADPGIIGRTTTLDAAPVTIIGVLPPDFSFPGVPELIMPLQHVGEDFSRGVRTYNGIGRLVAGAEVEPLRDELQGIFAGIAEQYPG